jgi:hypothetical protein
MCGVYAWEGLAATSPGRRFLEPICLAYIGATASGLATTGWQMFGHGTENGDLETAFEIGVASHARCFQVYLADIIDSAQTAALEYLASRL